MNVEKGSKKFRLSERLKSFKYAWNGIKLLVSEHNMRIHLVSMIIVIVLGFLIELNTSEWIAIVFAIGIVLMAEAFNTAIEHLSDAVYPEFDQRIGKVKDIAAGAVLIASIAALITGLIIFIPSLERLLSSN